jgi:hypothetical protein
VLLLLRDVCEYAVVFERCVCVLLLLRDMCVPLF